MENTIIEDRKLPSLTHLEPSEKQASSFLLRWGNGESYSLSYQDVRFQCPCAGCVNEVTGIRMLNRDSIPEDIRPTGVVPVGRYAVQIRWSDGHQTGMYSFATLFSLCEKTKKEPSS